MVLTEPMKEADGSAVLGAMARFNDATASAEVNEGEFQRPLQRTGHDGRAHRNNEPLENSSWQVQYYARTSARKSV